MRGGEEDRDPSPRQLEMLRVIHAHQQEHGYSPSYREIGDAMGIGSTNCVSGMFDVLVKKGCATKSTTTARSLLLTARGRAAIGAVSPKAQAMAKAQLALERFVAGTLTTTEAVEALTAIMKAGVS